MSARMSSTKKGSNYHFGMKVHTGTDSQIGLLHMVKLTTASVHDKRENKPWKWQC